MSTGAYGNALRYLPVVKFYQNLPADTPAFVVSASTKDVMAQSATNPGGRSPVQLIELRPDYKVRSEGMPGEPSTLSKERPLTLLANYSTRWKDTSSPGDWYYTPSKDEQAYRDLALNQYNADLTKLNQLEVQTPALFVAPTSSAPGSDDWQKQNTLKNLIAQLTDTTGTGYLETGYNLQKSGAQGIRWTLAAANVPVTVKSSFQLNKDQSQSFRLYRYQAPDGQANFIFRIEIGNDTGGSSSDYALELGGDGSSCIWYHYRNMTVKARLALQSQINAILDTGRLTVTDLTNILKLDNQIQAIQYKAKASGQSISASDSATISSLKDQIKAIKDAKRFISSGNQTTLTDLKDQLYLAEEKFSLAETSKNMIGKALDFTIQFLHAGFVVINHEDGKHVYENKRFTGGVPAGAPPIFGSMLPAGCTITIHSNGGKWDLVYGNPLYDATNIILGQPFELPFELDETKIVWTFLGDASNPGTNMNFSFNELTINGRGLNPEQYQIQITLETGFEVPTTKSGMYSPELYWLELHIPAGATPSGGDVIWDSQAAPNLDVTGRNRVMDLAITEELRRSRLCSVTIANPSNQTTVPPLLGGAAADCFLYDTQSSPPGNLVPVMKYGIVKKANRGEYKTFTKPADGEINLFTAVGNKVDADIIGCEGFLDKEIKYPFTINNMYVADALIALCVDGELPAALFANITASTGPKVKPMIPGKFPDEKPAPGTRFWTYMQELVKKHAPHYQLWTDQNGVNFSLQTVRDRTIEGPLGPALNYTDQVAINSTLRLRRIATEQGGLTLEQDLSEYYTSASFIGALNPITGMRYVGTETVIQATDPAFLNSMYYTGVENHYLAHYDDSLRSAMDCLMTAREFLWVTDLTPQGLAPWKLTVKADYDPTVRTGDLVTAFGIKFLVWNIDYSGLNSGPRTEAQQIKLILKLAEDVQANVQPLASSPGGQWV